MQASCNQNFRLSHSSLLIRFSDATTCATTLAELTEPSSPIPKECFRFRNHSEMLGLANTNTQLPDIIGEITAVKRKFYFA
ncbi:BnaC01g19580D [Brassica napus]|uniref:BnaC01g19580D protein n=1 Tax=Brassica napus TaxID=3708 RepID=A0A078GUT2_BRANA|nr:BnaC01g19580D [Brassica napus]